jgi:hypothetical protein
LSENDIEQVRVNVIQQVFEVNPNLLKEKITQVQERVEMGFEFWEYRNSRLFFFAPYQHITLLNEADMLISHVTGHNVVATTAKDEHFPEGGGRYTFCRVEVQKRFEHAGIGVEVLRGVDQRGDGKAMGNKVSCWRCSCGFRVVSRVVRWRRGC